jgi:hypothetical protein
MRLEQNRRRIAFVFTQSSREILTKMDAMPDNGAAAPARAEAAGSRAIRL